VVTYVHGWNHNADCCNENVECFRRSLSILSEQLNRESDQQAFSGDRSKRVSVVGLYVGWRGRTLPWKLNLATFWSRKSAAERVGSGDLRNFLHQLARLHDEYTLREGPFFGLVTIGHSFGGQAVFRATSQLLEHQLVEAGPSSLPRTDVGQMETRLSGRGVPATGDEAALITGLGDLVVLVNPAVEAAAFEPMRKLAASIDFDPALQNPSLVVFSAEHDVPRNYLFPVGRTLGTLFTSRRRGQWTLDRRAFGVYSGQQTHTLDWAPPPSDPTGYVAPTANSTVLGSQPGTCKPCRYRGTTDEIPSPEFDNRPENGDLGGGLNFAGSQLRPLQTARPFSPLLVIRTSGEIIDGHNGFFTHRFTNFLIRYVTAIEARQAETRSRRRTRLTS
jgi:hypothetical protein